MQLVDYLDRYALTLAEFGERVGVEPSTVSRWRDGSMFPTPVHMARIENVTGSKVTYRDFQKMANGQ